VLIHGENGVERRILWDAFVDLLQRLEHLVTRLFGDFGFR
jgi:hypothetical protein